MKSKAMIVWCAVLLTLAACASDARSDLGESADGLSGSTTLVNGLSPFVHVDMTSATTVIPTRTAPHGTALGILAVMEADRVNLPAAQGGGFRVISLVGTGITQTHDLSDVSWTTYSSNAGGPVAFPPNPRPTGISSFISADLTSLTAVDATHATKTGGCLGVTLEAVDRVNALANQGGGFRIASYDQAHHLRTCDTSSFRWAAH